MPWRENAPPKSGVFFVRYLSVKDVKRYRNAEKVIKVFGQKAQDKMA